LKYFIHSKTQYIFEIKKQQNSILIKKEENRQIEVIISIHKIIYEVFLAGTSGFELGYKPW
jgi:hypothetical protein